MRHFLYIFFLVISTQQSFGQSNEEQSIKGLYKKALIENDIESQKTLAKQLKSGYSNNELNYYKTLLKHTPESAILITNGLEDTYPITILQNTESIKTSVIVISLKLLDEAPYRLRLLKKYHLSTEFDKTSKSIYLNRLLLAKARLFISSTVNPTTYKTHNHNLFVVGLSLGYRKGDQYRELESFWVKLREKEKYKFNLTTKEKGIYSNYLPPLLTLYKMKLASDVKDQNLKIGILYLSNLLNKTTIVKNIIEQYEKGG